MFLRSRFFLSLCAVSILRKYYKVDAMVVAGMTAYRLGVEGNQVLIFSEKVDGYLKCTGNGVYALVE